MDYKTNFQGSGLSGIYNESVLPTGEENTYRGAKNVIIDKYDKSNSPFLQTNNLTSGMWSIDQQNLRRTSWRYFIDALHKKTESVLKYGDNQKLWTDLIKKHNSGTFVNFYFENEVDIFVPNKPLKDGGKNCQPTDEFKDIWKKAVIGIFTNNRCLKKY